MEKNDVTDELRSLLGNASSPSAPQPESDVSFIMTKTPPSSQSGNKRLREGSGSPTSAKKKLTTDSHPPAESSGENMNVTVRAASGGKNKTTVRLFVDTVNMPRLKMLEFLTLLKGNPHHKSITDIGRTHDQSGYTLSFSDAESAKLFQAKPFNNTLDSVVIRETRGAEAKKQPPKGRSEFFIKNVSTSFSTEDIKENIEANYKVKIHTCFRLSKNDRVIPGKRFAIPVIKIITDSKDAHLFAKEIILFDYNKCQISDPLPIIPPPQCMKCYTYDHITSSCLRQTPICRLCGKDHEQPNCNNQRHCVNCGGEHSARWANCPIYKQAAARQRQMNAYQKSQSKPPDVAAVTANKSYAIATIPGPKPRKEPSFLPHNAYNSRIDNWSGSVSERVLSESADQSNNDVFQPASPPPQSFSATNATSKFPIRSQQKRSAFIAPPASQLRSEAGNSDSRVPLPQRPTPRRDRRRRPESTTSRDYNNTSNTSAKPSISRDLYAAHATDGIDNFTAAIDDLFTRLESLPSRDLPRILIQICYKLLGLVVHQENVLRDYGLDSSNIREQVQRPL
jgi:hypothetical protein